MKKIYSLVTILTLFTVSCKKNEQPATKTTDTSTYMTAVVGSDSFKANFTKAQVGSDSSFAIWGFAGADTTTALHPYIVFTFRPWTANTRTYSFDTAVGVNHNYIQWVPSSTPDYNRAGSVVITAIDTGYISGTFHFKTLAGDTINNGSFRVRNVH